MTPIKVSSPRLPSIAVRSSSYVAFSSGLVGPTLMDTTSYSFSAPRASGRKFSRYGFVSERMLISPRKLFIATVLCSVEYGT